MRSTPKALRLHIGLFGRTNVGKSSFLNFVAKQDVAITSPVPGTTTDIVEKAMELPPIGPVVFLDTAGLDDASELGPARVARTRRALDRTDVAVLILEPDRWTKFEDELVDELSRRRIPWLAVVNKVDAQVPSAHFLEALRARTPRVLEVSSRDGMDRDRILHRFKQFVLEVCPDQAVATPKLVGDLVPQGGVVVLVVPLDREAPKGRLILPQVQAVRDALDHGVIAVVCRETEYVAALNSLRRAPDLTVCDSQVVRRVVEETPPQVPCTTFSILLARLRGDLPRQVAGLRAIQRLRPGDRILIAEACTHHAIEDDIGRVKIPRWFRERLGFEVPFDVCAGRDWPGDLSGYALIVHCGACMLTRREVMARIETAAAAGVPITNYGLCIAYLQGVLKRVLSPLGVSEEEL